MMGNNVVGVHDRTGSFIRRILPGSQGRVPELDGLRGTAILMVLFFHAFESAPLPIYLAAVGQLTWTAIDLFFVLSGFLIGGILLDARDSPNYFKTFYIRRAYRILPLYFVTLGSFWVLFYWTRLEGHNAVFHWLLAQPAPWYSFLSITQNFAMTLRGTLGPGWLGVTWSLAVEEQFYLTLPFIIRYVKPQRLPYVLAIFIVAAPIIRTLLRLFYVNGDLAVYVLLPCRADALLLGVSAAMLMRNDRARKFIAENKRLLLGMLLLLTCGMLWMALKPAGLRVGFNAEQARATVQSTEPSNLWVWVRLYARTAMASLNYSWIDLFYLCVLLIAVNHKSSLISRVLRSRVLLVFGTISYATYYFHQPMLGLGYGFFKGYKPRVTSLSDAGLTAAALLLTVALACLSWLYLERPLLRLGHRYHYDHKLDPAEANGRSRAVVRVTS
jgi:peptidoglycan/LPS O-acetylase OafA/YrhL